MLRLFQRFTLIQPLLRQADPLTTASVGVPTGYVKASGQTSPRSILDSGALGSEHSSSFGTRMKLDVDAVDVHMLSLFEVRMG